MKKVGNIVEFLHADKHQRSLEGETIFFGGRGWVCPGIPKLHKITNLQFLSSRLLNFLDFLHVNKPPRELRIDATILSEFFQAYPMYLK